MIGEKLWQQRWNTSSPATSSSAAKVPTASSPASKDDAFKKEDALLAKKIKGICRGC
jgi:hypothetical protein